MFTFPQADPCRSIWAGIWLPLRPSPRLAIHTHAYAQTHSRTHKIPCWRNDVMWQRRTLAWCKQVDRTARPALNPSTLSGHSGRSEKNQTHVHSLYFLSFFSFNRDETFHFIFLIDSGKSLTLDVSLSLAQSSVWSRQLLIHTSSALSDAWIFSKHSSCYETFLRTEFMGMDKCWLVLTWEHTHSTCIWCPFLSGLGCTTTCRWYLSVSMFDVQSLNIPAMQSRQCHLQTNQ